MSPLALSLSGSRLLFEVRNNSESIARADPLLPVSRPIWLKIVDRKQSDVTMRFSDLESLWDKNEKMLICTDSIPF